MSLGGYRVVWDPNSRTWKIQSDAAGNPVKANGLAAVGKTCTLNTVVVDGGSARNVSVPPSAGEVFFQVVGGGGGGGRHHNPPSSGGGAGAYAVGTYDVSGAAANVVFSASASGWAGTTDPGCDEGACNYQCTCGRGPGQDGGDSRLTVGGANSITAGGGDGGRWSWNSGPPGGTLSTVGTGFTLDNNFSGNGGAGGVGGPQVGNSGGGGSTACNWGQGGNDNGNGFGYGAGGGGGNNQPAGRGAKGVVVLMWTTCI